MNDEWVLAVDRTGLRVLWANEDHIFASAHGKPLVGTVEGGTWRFTTLAEVKGLDTAVEHVTGFGDEAWFYGGPAVFRWKGGTVTQIATGDAIVRELVVRGPDDVWAVGRNTQSSSLLLHWNGVRWSVVERPSKLKQLSLVGGPTPWLLEETTTHELVFSVFDGAQWVDSQLGELARMDFLSMWAPRPGEAVMVGHSQR